LGAQKPSTESRLTCPVRTSRRLGNLIAHLRRVATDERLRSAAVGYSQLDYAKAAIYLRLTSRQEFHRLKSCEKEPWTIRWVEEYLEPGQVLYDVGANVGAYTLVAAVAVPAARVVAFEPGPANFAALCANLELNDVADRVTPIPLALGDRPRSAWLGSDAGVPGASPRLDAAAIPEGARALVDRLDDVAERFDLPLPDHVKLDVDGGELEALAGAERLLAAGGVRSLMVELDREREGAVIDRLRALGFELVERASGPDRGRSMPTYGLFVPA
jgi:FkbM family methyltransferase